MGKEQKLNYNDKIQAEHVSRNVRTGISVRKLNFFTVGLTLLISCLLLYATSCINTGYIKMRKSTDNLILWQKTANELKSGSDELTEQVRSFAQTGDIRYLNGYFQESKVRKRRDSALKDLQKYHGESKAYNELMYAMTESINLMDREYYSMRLMAEAKGYNIDKLPEEIVKTALSNEDAALSPEGKEKKAREMVFDDKYRNVKDHIEEHMTKCLDEIKEDIEGDQNGTANKLKELLGYQRILIVALIIIAILSMLTTVLLVISPLLRAVVYIRAQQPIPIRGSNEFKFLARTYNLMFETQRQKNQQLAFQASHDRLTGLYNRRGFDFLIKNIELESSALLIIDVDQFKQYNDEYGHEMGDKVLAATAEELCRSCRTQDFVCRMGGDEFILIMVYVNEKIGEIIRAKIEQINKNLENPGEDMPPISISCGAAIGSQYPDAKTLLKAADEAMYIVKERGGKGVEIA